MKWDGKTKAGMRLQDLHALILQLAGETKGVGTVEQHHVYPLSTVRDFIEDKPNFTLLPIRYGGQLLYYQNTKAIYDALDTQSAGLFI